MALKNLLVHIDTTKAAKARGEAAIALAQTHEAHLIGLSIASFPSVPAFVEGQMPADVLNQARDAFRDRAREIAEAFGRQAEKAGISCEVRTDSGMAFDRSYLVNLHARYTDLAIVGQGDPDGEDSSSTTGLVEDVIMGSGRPVLVVPYIGAKDPIGRRVVVAWDASRESARAVNDALPILEKAESVTVMSVNPKRGVAGHGDEPGADIATHLARHGVEVDVQHFKSADIGISDTILSRVSDDGADLVVMGAYGHARMREVILGGVTRDMLHHMTVPVLMSH